VTGLAGVKLRAWAKMNEKTFVTGLAGVKLRAWAKMNEKTWQVWKNVKGGSC